jgi:hypothetical protein
VKESHVTTCQFRVSRELLAQAKAKAREEDQMLAQVMRAYVLRYVRGEGEMQGGAGGIGEHRESPRPPVRWDYCVLVRGLEALERLLDSDPFADKPVKLVERRDAQMIE